jgi:hypothetical protein
VKSTRQIDKWLDRLRREVAAVPDPGRAVVSVVGQAEVEFALGLEDAARESIRRALTGFDALHPGTWDPVVGRVAELCGRIGDNGLLNRELRRGMDWAADPEIVKYQGGLRERVRELAVQLAREDVAADLVSDEWPGRLANSLVDQCGVARWAGDTPRVVRLLPQAREAVARAGTGPGHLRIPVGHRLIRACLSSGLLADAADLASEYDFPLRATADLLTALAAAGDSARYGVVREGWLAHRLTRFKLERLNHHWASEQVRFCAEAQRRLGDVGGYRDALRRLDEVVTRWAPAIDSLACHVFCDLAVMHHRAGDPARCASWFDHAERLATEPPTGVSSQRGSKSLMASILSGAYLDVRDTDRALRFARRVSARVDRRMHMVFALILAGQDDDAEKELSKAESPESRAGLIRSALRVMLWSERDRP